MLETFGVRLKQTIEKKSMTVATVAGELSISPQAIHKWIAGNEISIENLRALAKLLGVNWIWLRYGDEAVHELNTPAPEEKDAVVEYRKSLINTILRNDRIRYLTMEIFGIGAMVLNVITGERQYGPLFCKMTGMTISTASNGAIFNSLLNPEDRDVVREATAATLKATRRIYTRCEMLSKPGQVFELCGQIMAFTGEQEEGIVFIKKIDSKSVSMQEFFKDQDAPLYAREALKK